jgi:hypothetical protein
MAGFVSAIHAFAAAEGKTWMPATSAGMMSREAGVHTGRHRISIARNKN